MPTPPKATMDAAARLESHSAAASGRARPARPCGRRGRGWWWAGARWRPGGPPAGAPSQDAASRPAPPSDAVLRSIAPAPRRAWLAAQRRRKGSRPARRASRSRGRAARAASCRARRGCRPASPRPRLARAGDLGEQAGDVAEAACCPTQLRISVQRVTCGAVEAERNAGGTASLKTRVSSCAGSMLHRPSRSPSWVTASGRGSGEVVESGMGLAILGAGVGVVAVTRGSGGCAAAIAAASASSSASSPSRRW